MAALAARVSVRASSKMISLSLQPGHLSVGKANPASVAQC